MLVPFYLNFLILTFLSATAYAVTSEKLSIEYAGKVFDLNYKTEYTNQLLTKEKVSLYVNSFEGVTSPDSFIAKKMKNFEGLFQDDKEPYTLQEFKRSYCLISAKNQTVHFWSGDEIFWSNCGKANTQYKTTLRSVRFWTHCKEKILEFTIKNFDSGEKLVFSCDAEVYSP